MKDNLQTTRLFASRFETLSAPVPFACWGLTVPGELLPVFVSQEWLDIKMEAHDYALITVISKSQGNRLLAAATPEQRRSDVLLRLGDYIHNASNQRFCWDDMQLVTVDKLPICNGYYTKLGWLQHELKLPTHITYP